MHLGGAVKLPSDSQRRPVNPRKTKKRVRCWFYLQILLLSLCILAEEPSTLSCLFRALYLLWGTPDGRGEGAGTSGARLGTHSADIGSPGLAHQPSVTDGCTSWDSTSAGPKTPSPHARGSAPFPTLRPGAHGLCRKGQTLPGGFAGAPRYHSDLGRVWDAGAHASGRD